MYNNFREKRGVDPREYYNRLVVGSGSPTRAPAASTSPQSSERGAVARPRPSAAPEGSDVDVDEYFVDGLAGAQDVANGRYVLAHTSGGRGVYRQSLSAGMDAGSERAWLFHSAGAWLLSPELAGYGSLPLRPLGNGDAEARRLPQGGLLCLRAFDEPGAARERQRRRGRRDLGGARRGQRRLGVEASSVSTRRPALLRRVALSLNAVRAFDLQGGAGTEVAGWREPTAGGERCGVCSRG